MPKFNFIINSNQIADQLRQSVSAIQGRVRQEAEALSVSAHAFIIQKAQAELKGFQLQAFLGDNNRNVRWSKVDKNIWVVEIDESAAWVEDGRPSVSMATDTWLLKPGAKGVKTAKDGSTYRSIPMTSGRFTGPGQGKVGNPVLSSMVKSAMKQNKISLKKIDMNPDGSPKLGVVSKLNIQAPGSQGQFPFLYSEPRDQAAADLTGLQPHGGIFKLEGAVVTQRMGEKGKVIREAITFRTVSSKHQAEGRWMAPEVKGLHSMQAAYDYVQAQWQEVLRQLESEFNT